MKKHNHKTCQCASCKSIRGEYTLENHPRFKNIKQLFCIDCHKKLNKKAHLFNTKRCHGCDIKHRHKKGMQIGKNSNLYKDGRMKEIFHCKECGKNIWYKRIRCKSCSSKYLNKTGKIGFKQGHNSTIRGKGSKKYLICVHHLDLNKSNNKEKNKFLMTCPLHSKLHNRAYKYLVKLGLIENYIKWFINNDLNNKEKLLIKKLNARRMKVLR
jgi:hypothetical protein